MKPFLFLVLLKLSPSNFSILVAHETPHDYTSLIQGPFITRKTQVVDLWWWRNHKFWLSQNNINLYFHKACCSTSRLLIVVSLDCKRENFPISSTSSCTIPKSTIFWHYKNIQLTKIQVIKTKIAKALKFEG